LIVSSSLSACACWQQPTHLSNTHSTPASFAHHWLHYHHHTTTTTFTFVNCNKQVHGTCLGLEALSVIVSGNTSILSDMDAEDFPAPLLYAQDADSSPFLKSLPPHVITNLQNQPIAMENHMHGEQPVTQDTAKCCKDVSSA
jgi:hypothetical protein